MVEALTPFLNNFLLMSIVFFFAACNPSTLLTRPACNLAQHVRCLYFSHACVIYRFWATYKTWTYNVEKKTEGRVDSCSIDYLGLVIHAFAHEIC